MVRQQSHSEWSRSAFLDIDSPTLLHTFTRTVAVLRIPHSSSSGCYRTQSRIWNAKDNAVSMQENQAAEHSR